MKLKESSGLLSVYLMLTALFFPSGTHYLIIGVVFLVVALSKKIIIHSSMPMLFIVYGIMYCTCYMIHYYGESFHQIIIFISYFFLSYYLIDNGIKSEREFEKVISFLVHIFTLYAGLCIIESFTRFNLYDIILNRTLAVSAANSYRFGIYRNHGITAVSINNGMILFMASLLGAYKYYNCKGKIIWKISYFIILISIICNMSRFVILVTLIVHVILNAKAGYKNVLKAIFACALVYIVFLFMGNASELISNVKSMYLPIFNDIVSGDFEEVSWGGTGERIGLWYWVYEVVKEKIFFGMGYVKKFTYTYYYEGAYRLKESIENHWLLTLYRNGLYGLIIIIAYFTYCIKKSFSRGFKSKSINIDFVFMSMTIGYVVLLFGCSGSSDLLWFYILMNLYIIYIKLDTKENYSKKECLALKKKISGIPSE